MVDITLTEMDFPMHWLEDDSMVLREDAPDDVREQWEEFQKHYEEKMFSERDSRGA